MRCLYFNGDIVRFHSAYRLVLELFVFPKRRKSTARLRCAVRCPAPPPPEAHCLLFAFAAANTKRLDKQLRTCNAHLFTSRQSTHTYTLLRYSNAVDSMRFYIVYHNNITHSLFNFSRRVLKTTTQKNDL